MRNDNCPAAASSGKRRAHRERVGDLLAEIIDQHGHRLVGKGLAEHLGGAHGRAGIADQRMRHRAEPASLAEEMRGRVGGVADKADRAATSRRAAAEPTEAA